MLASICVCLISLFVSILHWSENLLCQTDSTDVYACELVYAWLNLIIKT